MLITAKLNHLRISARKVRLVANLIKGLSVIEAEKQLKFLSKKSARPMLKLLNSAVANAQHNAGLVKENLLVKNAKVDLGTSLKRWRARAMGRAAPILKRTCHVTLILAEKEGTQAIPKTKPAIPVAKKEKDKQAAPKEVVPTKTKKTAEGESVEREIAQKDTGQIQESKQPAPVRPYSTTPQSKKRFFSRQPLGSVKKLFRRKSI